MATSATSGTLHNPANKLYPDQNSVTYVTYVTSHNLRLWRLWCLWPVIHQVKIFIDGYLAFEFDLREMTFFSKGWVMTSLNSSWKRFLAGGLRRWRSVKNTTQTHGDNLTNKRIRMNYNAYTPPMGTLRPIRGKDHDRLSMLFCANHSTLAHRYCNLIHSRANPPPL